MASSSFWNDAIWGYDTGCLLVNSNEWVGACNWTIDQLTCGRVSSVRCMVPVARRLYTLLMFRLAPRLSSALGIISFVNNGLDMNVPKFYNSPMTYVLFISVTFMELVSVCVSDSTRWDTTATIYSRLMNGYIERPASVGCALSSSINIQHVCQDIMLSYLLMESYSTFEWQPTILQHLRRESMVHSMFANIVVDK